MELRHLRYFVAVAEEQSFTKASEKLFIAQPPLSRQIQNLESELGIQLFERGSRPLKLTDAGQFFYQHAVTLLAKAEEVKTMTKRIGLIETTIRMGFVGSLLYGLLSRIVYAFRLQQPQLKIELIEMGTAEQIQALKEGRIDFGFGRLRISDSAISRVLLREERLILATHISHPWASLSEGKYLADVIDQNLLLYPNASKPNFSTQILGLFTEHGLLPKHTKVVREIQLALGLVAAGEGVAIVPESAKAISIPGLHYTPLLDSDAVSPIFLATRSMDDSDYIHSLFDCIYQIYDEEGIPYQRYQI